MREYLFELCFTQESSEISNLYSLIQLVDPIINTIEFQTQEQEFYRNAWNPPQNTSNEEVFIQILN